MKNSRKQGQGKKKQSKNKKSKNLKHKKVSTGIGKKSGE